MTAMDLADLKISVEPQDFDEDQFVSIWNVAAKTMQNDPLQTRMLASKFLGFLCKHRCAFVIVSPTDATYLDEWYERDNSLLYDWSPESDKVDVISQHAQVPFDTFAEFLREKKFSAEKNYSPRRADRLNWFSNDWNVG